MADRDFERELREKFSRIDVSSQADERMTAAIDRIVDARARPRSLRRPRLLLGVAAAALAVGGATAAYAFLSASEPTVPVTERARAGIAESPVLSRAPWLMPGSGAPPRIEDAAELPSIRFPSGTTYQAAVDALFHSVVERGELPDRAEPTDPLELGVVWDTSSNRPRLDLRAPFGYGPRTGLIRTPSYSMPRSLEPEESDRILRAITRGLADADRAPVEIHVDVPRLPPCQRRGNGPAPPRCPAVQE